MASLSFDRVEKRFGDAVVLDDLSFDVVDGEFFAILGRSRSGKSTILRLVAGLEEPTAGSILIGGNDVTDVGPSDRDIAMFFQNLALYPNKSGFENIASPLKARRVPRSEIAQRVREVAGLLGVEHLLNRQPATYSGGERQRVAIGRAIVRRANAYLFDEPLSNLDALVRLRMRGEFKRLQSDLGVTTLYVTPDQVEALAMADRIMVIDEGRVQQIGTPAEIYGDPANTFVASFVGSPPMNLLRGTVRRESEGLVFRHAASRAGIRIEEDGAVEDWPLEQDVVFGVRPEDLQIGGGGEHVGVGSVEVLGRRKLVALTLGDDTCQVLVAQDAPFDAGDSVSATCRSRSVRLFSPADGSRLATAAAAGPDAAHLPVGGRES